MGGIAEAIAVSVGWKDHEFRSCQAHHVSISPQEDCGGTAGKMGEVEGAAEEGGVDLSLKDNYIKAFSTSCKMLMWS